MNSSPVSGSVLAVHPTSSGFGWAVFDQSGELLEWSIASAKQGRKHQLADRFQKLLTRFAPSVLVLEAHEGERADRIVKLYRVFACAAADAGARGYTYDREAVAAALDIPARSSRYDVARTVAELLPELSHRIPRKQTGGRSEDPRQSLFAAAALALTYFTAMGVK